MYERYCQIRDRLGYNNQKVAELSGVRTSLFSEWKSGRSTPKTENLQKIADVLGVSLQYLATGEESKQAQRLGAYYAKIANDKELSIIVEDICELKRAQYARLKEYVEFLKQMENKDKQ